MHFVYIIYSPVLDKYYVGESVDPTIRHIEHNNGHYVGSWTSKVNDWILKKSIQFQNITQARKAEAFIKKMKSRKFIERLIKDSTWLEEKFSAEGHSPEVSGRIL